MKLRNDVDYIKDFTKDPRFCQTAQVFKKIEEFWHFFDFFGVFSKNGHFPKRGGVFGNWSHFFGKRWD